MLAAHKRQLLRADLEEGDRAVQEKLIATIEAAQKKFNEV